MISSAATAGTPPKLSIKLNHEDPHQATKATLTIGTDTTNVHAEESQELIVKTNKKDGKTYIYYYSQENKALALPSKTDRIYLVYLDVWERHLTSLDDEDIRESALGGPDTATRTKIVWQAKLQVLDGNAADIEKDLKAKDTNIYQYCSSKAKLRIQLSAATSSG